MQLTYYNSKFEKQKFPITLVCDNIHNAPNIGSIFRTADAFGVDSLIFCGSEVPIGKRMSKTSRSTEKYVSHQFEEHIEYLVDKLKESHYIIGLEITKNSIPLSTFKIKTPKPIAIIIGNENFGISQNILNHCHDIVHIDMYGHNSSMNVVQATSIALYEITNQLKQ